MKIKHLAIIATLILASNVQADVTSLQLERSAAHYARCYVAESLANLTIDHETSSNDVGGAIRESIRVNSQGRIRGIRVVDTYFDAKRNWAVARAELPIAMMIPSDPKNPKLAQVRQMLAGVRITAYGYASDDPEVRKIIEAIRRAQLDAYVQLTTELLGADYRLENSISTDRDMRFNSSGRNENRKLTLAKIVGEPVVDEKRHQVEVEMEVDLDLVRMLYGQQIKVPSTMKGKIRVTGKAGF